MDAVEINVVELDRAGQKQQGKQPMNLLLLSGWRDNGTGPCAFVAG
jgi:hypothetical protein